MPNPTEPAPPVLIVVWVDGGDLFLWHTADPTPRVIASGGVGLPYLSPAGSRVAFTRADRRSLWVIGTDGTGEQELVEQDVISSLRSGHPQINRVRWLGEEAVYFNTRQKFDNGTVNDDNLYLAALDTNPQLILPPGAGGDFEISPDGEHIAVISAGLYDTQEGHMTILDPLGVQVAEKQTFTALRAPDEPPFYPPLAWSAEGDFVRVPIPSRETDRVPLWRIPVEGDAAIFGYISAAPEGLPVWAGAKMLYLRAADAGVFDLMLADANGDNPQVYASGALANPCWLPDGVHFAYDRDGALWLGQVGQAPRLLVDPAPSHAVFLPDGSFVYATAGALLRGSYLDGAPQPAAIVQWVGDLPFDAVLEQPVQ